MYKKILDAFPPPNFLNIPYVGISISDSFVRSIKFGRNNRSLFVEKFSEKAIPRGIVEGGRINDTEGLVKILKEIKKEMNAKYARVSLPEEKAYLFETEIPHVVKEEIRSTIEFKIEENVPLKVAEVDFDYVITEQNRQTGNLTVVVSALPAKAVDAYAEAVSKAGISLLSLEIVSQAVARALLPYGTREANLILHFGLDKVGLYVVSSGIVSFTSTVSTKGENLSNRNFLLGEIKRVCGYWDTLKENEGKKEKQIQRIVICGEGIESDLVSYLTANQKVSVVLGNVWQNAFDVNDVVPPISFTDSIKFAPAIGLALPEEILI